MSNLSIHYTEKNAKTCHLKHFLHTDFDPSSGAKYHLYPGFTVSLVAPNIAGFSPCQ